MGQRARGSVRLSSAGVGRVDLAVRASPRRVRPAWPITGVPNAPGLDGVRGVAVVAVLAYHMDLAWTGGGFLGVEVFFALSGFLITQLIVDELSRTGRVDAWAFAKARARRLLPALVTCVVATLALFAWLAPAAGLRADGLASLLYVQNWHLVVAGLPYSEAFARPSPLLHLWSLSVEGQLYLLWPLLLVGVLATARPVHRAARHSPAGVRLGAADGAALRPRRRLAGLLRDRRPRVRVPGRCGVGVGVAAARVVGAAAARGPLGHRRRRDRGARHARRGVRGGDGVRRRPLHTRAGSCGSGCSPRC